MKLRTSSTRWLLGLGFLAATACGGAPAGGGGAATSSGNEVGGRDYAIRLHRPWRVGARSHVLIDAEKRMTVTRQLGDQAPEQGGNAVTAHLDATFEVLGINAEGHSVRERYVVSDFTLSQNDQTVHPLQAGQRVELALADESEDSTVTVDGQPASSAMREALDLVITLVASHDDDDELQGTSRRQPVGGSWDIHPEAMARSFHRAADLDVAPQNIRGQVRLAGLVREGGEPCLDVRTSVRIDGLQPPDLPAGFSVERGVVTAETSEWYPLDEASQPRRASYEMGMRYAIRGTSPQGGEAHVETRLDLRHAVVFTPQR